MTWTITDLRRLDLKYAGMGMPLHQRPFRAATELLGEAFSMGPGGNPEVKRICDAYEAMVPEAGATWPGMGTGLVASVDRVRKIVAPVTFGRPGPVQVWHGLEFSSAQEWWIWCREDPAIAAETHFAFADLIDFTYGADDLRASSPEAQTLWRMAMSNLGDVAAVLPTAASVDSVIQPICMVIELALKAALVQGGEAPTAFKGPSGHDLAALATRVAKDAPHSDDALVLALVPKLPPYVASRYAPTGLTRLEVVRLALGAQFIAASTTRRFGGRDMAARMMAGGLPARSPF